jgi:hypothetical protein
LKYKSGKFCKWTLYTEFKQYVSWCTPFEFLVHRHNVQTKTLFL